MTENPAVPTHEAASLMKEVSQRQGRVRGFIEQGGTVDFNVVFVSYMFGLYAGEGEWTLGRLLERAVFAVLIAVVALRLIRRRTNLGGRVQLATWLVAATVFAGTVAVNIRHGGDDGLSLAVWGGGLLVLAIAYRKASLLVSGGSLVIVGVGIGFSLAVIAWAIPLGVFVPIAMYFGRAQLFSSPRRAS